MMEETNKGLQVLPAPGMSTSEETDLPTTQPPSRITHHQKLTFIAMCMAYLVNMMSFSIIAPFFPLEAEKKNMSHTQIGLIFSIFNLVSFIASPILGKLIPVLGAKFTFLAGCWISGGCNFIFGFLDELDDSTQFLIFSFAVRILEGVGAAACLTAAMAITANAFPDNVAQTMGWLELFSGLGDVVGPPLGGALYTGWMEVFSGIGYGIGPPIGGILYKLGGYKLPFMVQGGGTIVILVVNLFLMPNQGVTDTQETGSVLEFLKIPAVWPVSYALVVGSAALGFLDPTLSIHLKQFDLSPAIVGTVFLLVGGFYALFSPLWGYIADVKKVTRLMIVLGFYAAAIAYLLIGPSKVLKLPNELWIICIGLGLLGCAIGIGIVPTFLDLLNSAFWYDLPDNLATQSIVSGQFNAMFSLGQFIGPFAGGLLVDENGFPAASSYFACANISVVIVVSLFGVWEYQCGLGKRKPKLKDEISSEDETSELIPEASGWE